MLLLLQLFFVNELKLKLMFIYPIERKKSNLIHLHGFHVLLLLSLVKKVTPFVCNNKTYLFFPKPVFPVITVKEFLDLLNLLILIKQWILSPSPPACFLSFCANCKLGQLKLSKYKSSMVPALFNDPCIRSSKVVCRNRFWEHKSW